jgi:serine/threonine protein kinase
MSIPPASLQHCWKTGYMSSVSITVSGSASEEFDASNWDWADRGTPHVLFSKDEPLPFQEGDVLGHGVNGPVTQTVIKGVRVALKKIYCRQGVRQKHLQEIEIIRKLKHPHIIQLAGSYTRERYLGILLYPVATCDLTTFLEDVDYLQRIESNLSEIFPSEFEERTSRCKKISRIIQQRDPFTPVLDMINAARARIWESYGCITSAMLYLHNNSIKHKDIKPLNILLSHDGLWITDFGHSTDFSEFSNSATTGGERGTIKYCAPEVAAFERSGRSADVFSLGCIFFEMAALRCFTLEEMTDFRPSADRSFHKNLDNIFPVFDTFGSTALDHLPMSLVKRMLSRNPADRPDLASISKVLGLFQAFSTIEPDTFASTRCPHHDSPPVFDMGFENFAVEELLITIGNTSHEETGEFVKVEGAKRKKIPIVVFVECSSMDYIDFVIFFQVSMSDFSLKLTLLLILHASHMFK